MSDLRGPLVDRFEELARETTVGEHGDPHAAFVVFVYPDREPTVLGATRQFLYGLTGLSMSDDSDDGEGSSEAFPFLEFDEARHAMDDAWMGLLIGRGGGYLGSETVGECVSDRVRSQWERRRMDKFTAELAAADDRKKRPARCENRKRRFTERGLAMHFARSPCGAKIQGTAT